MEPQMLTAAAADLAKIGAAIDTVSTAAAASTTNLLPAAADEVSAAIASLFGTHALAYQAIGAQAATFHDGFVQALSRAASRYAASEVANVEQNLLGLINAPTQALFGRPLIGNGADGAPGTGQTGQAGGLLWGNGGAGGSGAPGQSGGNGGPPDSLAPAAAVEPAASVLPAAPAARRGCSGPAEPAGQAVG
ncbi:PE family protein, partial [Mycobacterium ulcerans str. Harvey]